MRCAPHPLLGVPGQPVHHAVSDALDGCLLVAVEGLGRRYADDIEAERSAVVFYGVLEHAHFEWSKLLLGLEVP